MVTVRHRSPKSTELRRKVPPLLLMLADLRPFFTVFGVALAMLIIHGPVVGRPDYNGLRYLLAPWLCPAVIATYYYVKPYRPYRVGAARIADLTDHDAHDPDAQRLVEIFQSREARHFLLRAMLRLSGRLFGIMLLLAILHWQSLTWTLTSPWLGQGQWVVVSDPL
jgi:hypothetical protein